MHYCLLREGNFEAFSMLLSNGARSDISGAGGTVNQIVSEQWSGSIFEGILLKEHYLFAEWQ